MLESKKLNVLISWLLIFVMCFGLFPLPAQADTTEDVAYVTIAVEGDLKLVHYPVNLSDVNNSGGYDLDDALYLAHNEETGMEGGYESYTSQYGLGISMLWGDTSGWFGYTVNGDMAGNLSNAVKAGDEIYAWVYTCQVVDTTKEDIRASFDKLTADVVAGEPVEVTLNSDAVSNGADVAVYKLKDNHKLGAEVETDAVFDADGKAAVTFDEAGTFVITAAAKVGSAKALIPPYCVVTVGESLVSSDVIYTVGSVTGAPGETVQVPINVQHSLTEGLVWWLFTVNLDDGLELVSTSNGSATPSHDIFKNGNRLELQCGGGVLSYMPQGEIVVLNVKIADDAAAGTYNVGMSNFNYYGQFAEEITGLVTTVNEGVVTVEGAAEPSEPIANVPWTVWVGDQQLTLYDGGEDTGCDAGTVSKTIAKVPAGTTSVVIKNTASMMIMDIPNHNFLDTGTKEYSAEVAADGSAYCILVGSYYHLYIEVEQGENPGPDEPSEPIANVPWTVWVGDQQLTLYDGGEDTGCDAGTVSKTIAKVPAGTTSVVIKNTASMMIMDIPNHNFLDLGTKEYTAEVAADGSAYCILVGSYYHLYIEVEQGENPGPDEPSEPIANVPWTVWVGDQQLTLYDGGEDTGCDAGTVSKTIAKVPAGTTSVVIKNTASMMIMDIPNHNFLDTGTKEYSAEVAADGSAYCILVGSYYHLYIEVEQGENPGPSEPEEPEEPVMPFTVTVGGEEMTKMTLGEVNDPYNGTKPLYTVTIPEGTTEVTITWKDGNNYTLSYYDANANYFGFESAKKNSWTIAMDKNGDGAYDMLQIYDSGYGVPYWITFVSEEPEEEPVIAPFTVTVGGEEMTEMTLGEVNDPYNGTKPLYTVTIPEGTTEVTITWKDGNNYTLSYYDANANYFGFESAKKNSWTIAMDKNGDGAYDMLQIYDSGYGVPYWITFTSGTEEPDEPVESNVVALGNAEAWPGDLIELSIFAECVENDTNVFGRRFIPTLALPDGWTIVGAVAGEGLAGTVWELYGTDLYGWCLNGTAENYYGAYLPSGELMKFQIQVAADAEAGEYTVELASAKMMKDDWSAGFTDFELVAGTVTVSIPEDKTKLDAPVLTEDSVFAPETYIEITVPASEVEPAAIVEYAISTDGTTWSEWQTDNKFTEVEDGTKYYVRARYMPFNDTWYEVSDASNVIEVTTKAFVEEPVIFTVGDVIGGHGDTVYIPVSLSHSFDGLEFFSYFRFCLEDNENLTLVEAANGSDSDDWSVNYEYAPHRAVGVHASGLDEIPEGEIVILEYKIQEDATPGTYQLGLDQEIEYVFFNYSVDGSGEYGTYIEYPVNIQVVESTVTIKAPLTTPVLSDYTATDDTVTVTAPAAVENATVEYAISYDGGETYGEWQTSNVFGGLAEETVYYIIARYIAGDGNEYVDSYASEPMEVKTVNPTATYTLAEVTAKAGETVDVAVSLTHNVVKQATSFQIIPAAAAGLTLQDAKAGADLPEGWKIMLVDDVVTVYTDAAAAIPSGQLVVLTYKVADDAADGEYAVTLSESFTEDGNAFVAEDDSILRVNGTVVAGAVTVMTNQYGDLDNDGVVDMKDLASLRRYLAGWDGYNAETLNTDAIDLNADGTVDMTDAIILNRHLAGWEDYKVLPVA